MRVLAICIALQALTACITVPCRPGSAMDLECDPKNVCEELDARRMLVFAAPPATLYASAYFFLEDRHRWRIYEEETKAARKEREKQGIRGCLVEPMSH